MLVCFVCGGKTMYLSGKAQECPACVNRRRAQKRKDSRQQIVEGVVLEVDGASKEAEVAIRGLNAGTARVLKKAGKEPRPLP